MDLSIIYVNWNSLNYLRECIKSVYEHTHGIEFELIVVDNASPEGGVDAIKEEFPDVVLIKSGVNLGFAGANNVGFRQSKGKCVLFLNPDMKVLNPAINVMYDRLQSLPDAGIVGCRMHHGDLRVMTNSMMRFPGILNQLFQIEVIRLRWPSFPLWNIAPLFSKSEEPARAQVITGACMMMRREVFEKVRMFNEEYFMYAEDFDLCWKITRAGYTNYFCGGGDIIHYGGASSPREWQTIMKMKADVRLIRNFRGPFYALLFRAAMVPNAFLRLLVASALRAARKDGPGKTAARDAAGKWRAILKTLLTPLGPAYVPPDSQRSNSTPIRGTQHPTAINAGR
jgi:GT2 family glycosyltransferase